MNEHYSGNDPIPPELAKPLNDLESAVRRFGSAYAASPDAVNDDLLDLELAALKQAWQDLQEAQAARRLSHSVLI